MYLGIDLGTSGVKLLLMDESQQVIGAAIAGLSVAHPRPGWAEQAPADWITATEAAMQELARQSGTRLAAVRAIGLSGQMHGSVALDRADRVLRPAILWNDGRAQDQARRLDARPEFRAISGNIVFPGFTAPKLVWMAEHEPDLFQAVARVLLPKDYLRLWLTGDHVSEMSDAAGTSWLDTAGRCWSPELLAASLMRPEQMPRLVEGNAPSGTLRPELARRWGMGAGVIVAGGAGDNAATAVGAGTVRAGEGFLSLGTSGVLFAATDHYQPRPESAVHVFCHALPGMWHAMGVILAASAALEWLAAVSGTTAAALAESPGPALRPPGEITFLPYLSGERTPHNDAALRGQLSGLSIASTRAEIAQAVMEGVAFAFADNLRALRLAGSDPRALLAFGGGSRSFYWLKAIATALDLPILVPEGRHLGAAFGAARLGLMAETGAPVAAICQPPAIAAEILPDPLLRDAFRERHALFQRLRR